MTGTHDRSAIRRAMRKQRRALSASDRAAAADALNTRLQRLLHTRNTRNIAAYIAVQGEIELDPVIHAAWARGIPVYLPRLRDKRMEFHRYSRATRMVTNRFGIPEPEITNGSRINARFLDLVLAPLVAFDEHGGRLGTGGGYYDRTFAFLRHRHHWQRPTLLGVAYEFQGLPTVPSADWDIPLHGVVTNENARLFR